MNQKKREKKLKTALITNRDFLIQNLKEEWEEIERFTKRDEFKRELKRKSKEAAVFMMKSILVFLAVGGVLAVAAVAPNIFVAFSRHGQRRRYFEKKDFGIALRSLKKRGLIKLERNLEEKTLQLTDRGEQKVLEISFKNFKLNPSGGWDGYWRVVFFDIPLRNKWAREGFREKLKSMGFYPLQKSVFIIPHPCKKEIDFLCGLYNIRGNVRLVETKSIGDDNKSVSNYFGCG